MAMPPLSNLSLRVYNRAVMEVENSLPLSVLSDCANSNTSSRSRRVMNLISNVRMRDRSKNRKQLQKGRNLSIEAIQTVQALKRAAANKNDPHLLHQVFDSKFRRLLKFDMLAVLHELLRQNECFLALQVFEDVQKEYWYKPRLSLYAEIISALGRNGLLEMVDNVFTKLKMESSLEADLEGFNVLLETLASLNLTGLAMEIFYMMKSLNCDPDRVTFKILIKCLDSNGETNISAIVQQEAEKYYGKCLNFLEEAEETVD